MSKFYAKDGLFWLDDQPILLQAGEFHYYRTPADQWAHRLGLLKQAGFNAVASYMPWMWHEMKEGDFDFDGHSHPMRNLAGFLDLAAEMGLWIIARPGPYIMAESINEGIPQWVFTKYPAATFIDQQNHAQNIASYLHPDFLICASRWYQAIFGVLTPRQVTRRGRIVLVQLDNEMGMLHWVRNIMDTNPDTLARFAAYLQAVYGGRLAVHYPASDLAAFLRDGILCPQEPYAARLVEDYRRYYRFYLRAYASFLLSEARRNGLEVPPVINIHGFANGGKTFPIGISQLIEAMEIDGMVSATDVYPLVIGEGTYHQLLLVNAMTQALHNPAQPLFSIEFQSGGNHDFSNSQSSFHDLHARLSFSVGMRAINHYLFFGGMNHPLISPVKRHDWGHPVRTDGSLRGHFARYPRLSAALTAYGEALTRARPQTVTTIGFRLDDFMTEVSTPATAEATRILTHQREVVLFDFIARGLALTHRPFNALELSRARLDLAATPHLWVMLERQCEAAIQQKLIDYVRAGGKLALVGRMCLEDGAHKPCTLLKDALGVTSIDSDPPFTSSEINAFEHCDVPISFAETYKGSFEEVFARRGEDVIGFVKTLGKGRVLFFGAALPTDTLEDLNILHQMALKMGCAPLFTLSTWADTRISCGENGSFLFINNYLDDPIETVITRQEAALFDGQPVCLPARQGAILPLDWQLEAGILLHYLTVEVRDVLREQDSLSLLLAQEEFAAELTLSGWECPGAEIVERFGHTCRARLHGKDGRIHLKKESASAL